MARPPTITVLLEQLDQAAARENALRDALAAAGSRIAELVSQMASMSGQIGVLTALVASSNERVAELLAIAQRKKRGPERTVESPSAPAPSPGLDESARKAFDERPKAPELPAPPTPPKKPRRPTGRKPLPEHLPVDEHEVRPECCSACSSVRVETVDEVVETKLHVVKEHQRKRQVTRKTVRCVDCGGRTTARSLPAPFPRSKVTCEWLAHFIHQKFAMLTPLDRMRRDLASRGIPLSMGFLVSQTERAADLLAAVDGEHWKQLRAGTWMATDATGLAVLVPELGVHHGYIEVFRRTDLVVFQYEPEKGGRTLASKLAGFDGTLVADAEHRHNAALARPGLFEQGCNAHGRRRFRDAEDTQPVLAAEGGAFIAAIYGAEDEARRAGLTGEALAAWRQEKVPPLCDGLRRWMDAVEPGLTPDDPVAKAIRYYRNHWTALFRFVERPELPLDNSASEREFQSFAKLRFNMLFAGSAEGAHRATILLGIVATCRAIGVNAEEYLGWAFTRLGTHRDVYGLPTARLTPAAFKQQRARAGPPSSPPAA